MNKKPFYLLILGLLISISIFSQSLVFEEKPEKLKTIKDTAPEGKALLIFESNLDLEFESSMEFLQSPVRFKNIYKLSLNELTCVITVKNLQTASQAILQFGQISSGENSRPSLKSKQSLYFIINQVNTLDYFDITEKNIANGVAIDNQMLYEKEALIIFNVDPIDLELEFNSSQRITEIKKEPGRYRLYIQPYNQTITIKHRDVDDTYILLKDLLIKEVRYYFIRLPDKFRAIETQSTDKSLTIGSYIIETKPPGAKIEMFGNPDFNKQNYKTPFIIEGYETGTKIIFLKLNEHEVVQDTIYIGKGKANKSVYNLIPEFAFLNFNIDPAPPSSKIFIDGLEIDSVYNDLDFKITKGDKKLEIKADHYYTETLIVSTSAGNVQPVKVKLKPKMGTLTVSSGENAENSDVYVNEYWIGILPISDYPLQEGEHKIKIKKDGFVTEKDEFQISISENKPTILKNINMLRTKRVKIITTPVTGATVYIDNKQISGTTNLITDIGVGKHDIRLYIGNFEPFEGTFFVTQEINDYSFELTPILLPFYISCKDPVSVYIDDDYKGITPMTVHLAEGRYSLKLGSKNTKYKARLRIPNDYTKPFPLYSPFSAKMLGAYYNTSIANADLEFVQLSVYGFSATVFKINILQDCAPVSFLTNPEFRMGGAIFRNIDLSLLTTFDYSYSVFSESLYDSTDNKKRTRYTKYFYGLEMKTHSFKNTNTGNFINFRIKIGIENSDGSIERVKDDFSYNDKEYFGVKNRFTISIGINMWDDANEILRLWHKPMFDNFRY